MEISVFGEKNQFHKLWKEWKFIVFHPMEFFDFLVFKQDIKWPIFFYAIMVFVTYLFRIIVNMFTGTEEYILISLMFVLSYITPVLTLLFLHPIILLFKGKGTFRDTLCVILFSHAVMVFSAIPFAGSNIYWIWFLILQIIGVERLHKLSKLRAILSIFIPYFITAFITLA